MSQIDAEPHPHAPSEPAVQETLWFDACHACAYSFEGLPVAGRCPECGTDYDRRQLMLPAWLTGYEGGITSGRANWKTYAMMAIPFLIFLPQIWMATGIRRHLFVGLFFLVCVVVPLRIRGQRWSRSPFVLIANDRGVARLDARSHADDSWLDKMLASWVGWFVLLMSFFAICYYVSQPAVLTGGLFSILPFAVFGTAMGFFAWRYNRQVAKAWQCVLPGRPRYRVERAVAWGEGPPSARSAGDGTIVLKFGRPASFGLRPMRIIVEGDGAFADKLSAEFDRLRGLRAAAGEQPAVSICDGTSSKVQTS